MSKFHINKHGLPAPCKAQKGNCPYGGSESHYDSIEEAQRVADNLNKNEFGLLPTSRNFPKEMKNQVAVMKHDFDKDKFIAPYGNRGNNKPDNGGFWTSTQTEDGDSDWINFARREGFYEGNHGLRKMNVTIADDSKMLIIDSREDYEQALETYGMKVDPIKKPLASIGRADKILDFEKLTKDYDALTLTKNGMRENNDYFYGWDCESTVWLNVDKFESVTEGEELK